MKKQTKEIADTALVEKFNNGSIEAFEEIVKRYETKVFNLAMRFTRNQEDAEEVLQDVFITLYRKLSLFQGKSAFSSWLYRIVVNAAFMKLRKKKQTAAISVEDLSPTTRMACFEGDTTLESRTDTLTTKHELRVVLEAAINKLPEQYRAVFILRDVDGLSNEEAGKILDLTVAAIKSRLHRSRLLLRRKLQKYYDDYTGEKPIAGTISNNSSYSYLDEKLVANQ